MQIAVFSNVQGNLSALRAVLADIDARAGTIDRIICAGDVVGRGPEPNEVLDLLQEREVATVLGNYDDAVAFDRIGSGVDFPDEAAEEADRIAIDWTRQQLTPANLAYLQRLPRNLRLHRAASGVKVQGNPQDERTAEYRRTFFARAIFGGLYRPPPTVGRRILVVHGSPRALNEYVREDTANSILAAIVADAQADLLISGHAGIGFHRSASSTTFVGAGSVSGAQVAPGLATYMIARIRTEVEVEFPDVRYDPEAYLTAMRKNDLPEVPSARFSGLGITGMSGSV